MKKLMCITLLSCLPLWAGAAPEDDISEPEIVIKEKKDKVIHEYRINGFVYAIKVFPKNGKPYYLVAEEGGNFAEMDDRQRLVPQWEIFNWK